MIPWMLRKSNPKKCGICGRRWDGAKLRWVQVYSRPTIERVSLCHHCYLTYEFRVSVTLGGR